MDERPWWLTALQWLFWLIAMIGTMTWFSVSRLKQRDSENSNVLVYPIPMLIFGLLGSGLFIFLVVISNVYPNETANWMTTTIFATFALMFLWMVFEYLFVRLEIRQDELEHRNFLGLRRQLSWDEIESVAYSDSMNWFRLRSRNGTLVRVSSLLIGLPSLAPHLIERVPPDAFDEDTLTIVRSTAEGKPPSLWP